MKKFLISLSMLSFLFTAGIASAWGLKVAVFNLNKVIKNDPQAIVQSKNIRTSFLPAGKKIVQERNKLNEQFKKYRSKFDKNPKMKSNFLKQLSTLRNKQIAFNRKLSLANSNALNKVLTRIRTVVRKIARNSGYDLVFTNTNVAYNRSNIDITNQIIKELKKSK